MMDRTTGTTAQLVSSKANSATASASTRRHFSVVGIAVLAGAAGMASTVQAAKDASSSTNRVLDRHLGAFAKGLDAIMADYAEDSVILNHDKAYRGLAEIRSFFDAFLKSVKPGFWEAFKITARGVDREVAYLVWESKPFIGIATDTLVVRGNKIKVQTFTAG